MNESPAMSSMCLDSNLILRSASKNPAGICDVVRQYCVFSVQYILFQLLGLNKMLVLLPDTQYRDFTMIHSA